MIGSLRRSARSDWSLIFARMACGTADLARQDARAGRPRQRDRPRPRRVQFGFDAGLLERPVPFGPVFSCRSAREQASPRTQRPDRPARRPRTVPSSENRPSTARHPCSGTPLGKGSCTCRARRERGCLIVLRCCGIGFRIAARARSRLLSLCGWRNAPAYGGYGYGGYGYGQRGYFRGGYGGAYRPHYDYHDTTHLDYHPGTARRHFDHYDYTPGHYDVHRSGHWDRH